MIKLRHLMNENSTPGGIKFGGIFTPEVWERIKTITKEKGWYNGKDLYKSQKLDSVDGPKFNSWWCYWFPEAVIDVTGDKGFDTKTTDDYRTELKSYSPLLKNVADHAFLVKNNKFYDIEVPQGVDNVWELPFFQRKIKSKQDRLK